jgi:hypothetical protein
LAVGGRVNEPIGFVATLKFAFLLLKSSFLNAGRLGFVDRGVGGIVGLGAFFFFFFSLSLSFSLSLPLPLVVSL